MTIEVKTVNKILEDEGNYMTSVLEGGDGDDFLKRVETYKDMKFVTKELKRLVRQLIKYERDGKK